MFDRGITSFACEKERERWDKVEGGREGGREGEGAGSWISRNCEGGEGPNLWCISVYSSLFSSSKLNLSTLSATNLLTHHSKGSISRYCRPRSQQPGGGVGEWVRNNGGSSVVCVRNAFFASFVKHSSLFPPCIKLGALDSLLNPDEATEYCAIIHAQQQQRKLLSLRRLAGTGAKNGGSLVQIFVPHLNHCRCKWDASSRFKSKAAGEPPAFIVASTRE
jgi:hypothetical protein